MAENTQEPPLPLHISSPYSLGPGWQFVVPQHQAQQPLVNPVSRSQGCNVGLAAGLAGCCSLLQQRAQVRHGQTTAQVCLTLLGRERVRGVLWQRHLKSCDKYGPLKGLSQRSDIGVSDVWHVTSALFTLKLTRDASRRLMEPDKRLMRASTERSRWLSASADGSALSLPRQIVARQQLVY